MVSGPGRGGVGGVCFVVALRIGRGERPRAPQEERGGVLAAALWLRGTRGLARRARLHEGGSGFGRGGARARRLDGVDPDPDAHVVAVLGARSRARARHRAVLRHAQARRVELALGVDLALRALKHARGDDPLRSPGREGGAGDGERFARCGHPSVETKSRTLRTASAVASAPGLGSSSRSRFHVDAMFARGERGAEARLGVASARRRRPLRCRSRSGALTHNNRWQAGGPPSGANIFELDLCDLEDVTGRAHHDARRAAKPRLRRWRSTAPRVAIATMSTRPMAARAPPARSLRRNAREGAPGTIRASTSLARS